MNAWNEQVFAAGAVNKGNMVRRKLASILKYGNLDELIQEAQRRGFHVFQNGDQVRANARSWESYAKSVSLPLNED
jgi:hypothetical protein